MNEHKLQDENHSSGRMSRFGFKKPRIFPPIWLAIAFLAMLALDRWLPLVRVVPVDASVAAWLLIVTGLALAVVASAGFRRARTGIIPFSESTALVTSGIYRFSRNPMYLGMVVVLAGVAVRLGSLGAWIPLPLFIAVIQQQFIRNEETFLTGIYGEAFLEYKRRVRRWI